MQASVVLVDSDSTSIAPAQAALQSMGCELFSLRNIHEAQQWCPRIQPDLILVASSAFTGDARQIIHELKAAPRTRLTPVVTFGAATELQTAANENAFPVDESLLEPIWHPASLERIQGILALKKFVDSETEAALISAAISLEDYFLWGKEGHCQRVSDYAVRLGRRAGMAESQLEALRLAAVLHDIGKLTVPAAILNKPGPLTDGEREQVQRHPAAGEEICSPLKSLRAVLPIIRHHHERMNGTGYPDGLEGEEIPLAARVLQIADIYDALTTDRPYRAALPKDEAMRILHEETEQGWWDDGLVNALGTLNLQSDLQDIKSRITPGTLLKTEKRPGFLFGSCPQFVLHPSGLNS